MRSILSDCNEFIDEPPFPDTIEFAPIPHQDVALEKEAAVTL
jgi:hypothetical protein